MLLGDVIARLSDETNATEVVLGLGDLALLSRMRARSEEAGVSLGAYAAWAFRTYAHNASADEWVTLLGAMCRSDDPGGICLSRAFVCMLSGTGTPRHGLGSDV